MEVRKMNVSAIMAIASKSGLDARIADWNANGVVIRVYDPAVVEKLGWDEDTVSWMRSVQEGGETRT
ncbi:MAG: hypothetical protein N3G75_06760 [Methanothrix sp.]|nr:hypothetical protein [Methanothrix sp.]MCX8207517.1 hypothetical protein [Methanothrix sp.]